MAVEVRLADLLAGLSRLADVVETVFREIVGMPEPEITARESGGSSAT